MKPKTAFKKDVFKKARGGHSRLMDICCSKCEHHLCFYQKDGPGMLKRMYLDRIYDSKKWSDLQHLPFKRLPRFICDSCHEVLGVPMIYKKENRTAFRLFQGSIQKKITKGV